MQDDRFPQKTVYLCGPITGLSYEHARHTWREEANQLFLPHIHSLSPMRAKDFLKGRENLQGMRADTAYENPMATPKGIVARDSNDIRNADAVLAHFLGANAVSIGSVWEIGVASALNKPIVLVMEKDCEIKTGAAKSEGINPHIHVFVTESAGYWVDTLDEAVWIINHLLTPGI